MNFKGEAIMDLYSVLHFAHGVCVVLSDPDSIMLLAGYQP